MMPNNKKEAPAAYEPLTTNTVRYVAAYVIEFTLTHAACLSLPLERPE